MTQPANRAAKARPMRIAAFRHALNGLRVLVTTQPNARFHLAATVLAVATGLWCRLSTPEWASLVLAITFVWLVEGLNTAIEFLVDLVSPERRELAGWAKDVAAGAVLLASIGAVIVGGVIFGGRLWRFVGR
jgi:diacylglycerol kinase